MANPNRSEVWLVDLGMIAKIRPALVISIPPDDANDRVLTTLIPHTTSLRGSRFEVVVRARFLKAGAFDAQNVVTIPQAKLIRRLGTLSETQMESVLAALCHWLGIEDTS
jgi:mRNA interferase MazF